jgi:hypothetical protein
MKPNGGRGGDMKPAGGWKRDTDGKYWVDVDANGYAEDPTTPLLPVVGFSDFNNPRLRQLGKAFAAEAYNLADELHSRGADPEQLLLPWRQRRRRPLNLKIPYELADIVAAVLLALPRHGEGRGRRSRWGIKSVEAMIRRGMSVRAAAKAEAARTGASEETIERAIRDWRARKKQRGGN